MLIMLLQRHTEVVGVLQVYYRCTTGVPLTCTRCMYHC